MAVHHQGQTTREPLQVAEILADYFASLSAYDEYPDDFKKKHQHIDIELQNIKVTEDNSTLPINKPFSLPELEYAVQKGHGKSEGNDEVGYPLLKHLPPNGKRILLNTINKEWVDRTIPSSWRHSLVIPIPKKDGAASSPSHYRPISLTCCTGKIMERMINRRLVHWLEEHKKIDQRQHAFRSGHGTGSYFSDLAEILRENTPDNHIEIAALDLAKAYNRAWTPRVIQLLLQWGLAGNLIHYLINFLDHRTFEVCIGNHRSSIHREEVGVPQGSVIAVTIFLIGMYGVYDRLPANMYALTYADDIVLIVPGKTQRRIRRTIQAAVTRIAKWASDTGFAISAPKCELLHTCKRSHKVLSKPVQINGVQIPRKQSMRILGIIIDRTLSFGPHIAATKKSCLSRLNLLKSLSRKHKLCNRGTLLGVAEKTIDSKLLYGAELLCLETDTIANNLAPLHNRAVRMVSGLLPSTPADVACAESGALPFRHQFAKTIIKRAISLIESRTGDEETYLITEAKRLLQEYTNQTIPEISQVQWVGLRDWDQPQLKVDKVLEGKFRKGENTPLLHATFKKHLEDSYSAHQIHYSDGSVQNSRVGVGIHGPNLNRNYRLNDICNIFSAEAMGILKAATAPSTKPLLVISDSQSAITALQNDANRHPWIHATMKAAPQVTFMWVPSHVGIRGNEKADENADMGRERIRPNIKTTPGHDARKHIAKLLQLSWNATWNASNTHLRQIKNTTGRWEDPKLQTDQRVISRLRTGHTRFTYRMGGGGPFRIRCPICNVHNTVQHVLLQCPQYEPARNTHDLPTSIRQALCNDPAIETRIIRFMKDVKLYHET